jgi:hypothetical protein
MRLGWKIFLPLSLLFVFLVSGWLMLTRYGAEEQAYSPSRSHLAQLRRTGGTDVCYADQRPGSATEPLIITRAREYPAQGSVLSIIRPARMQGDIRIRSASNDGEVGGGQGIGPTGEVGIFYNDVMRDGRPGLMLFMTDSGGQEHTWDCRSEMELERLPA